MYDFYTKEIRASAVLTTGYVAGTIIENTERYNQLVVYIDFTKGSLTSGEVKLEFTDRLLYTLAYDGQTANFTAGDLVVGKNSNARGVVLTDADGGATGTLTLKNVVGTFQDNEPLTSASGGYALVNGTLTEASVWRQETASSVTGGTSTLTVIEHSFSATAANYRHTTNIKDKFIKISAKGTGTTTSSAMRLTACLGNV